MLTTLKLRISIQQRQHSAAAAKSLQSCPTLCISNPIDGSPPGSPILGILQARTLEWVAISFSNAWKWKVKVKTLSCVWLLATPRTTAHQAPPSMGFSRQEYWSGVPLSSPRQHEENEKISYQLRDLCKTCNYLLSNRYLEYLFLKVRHTRERQNTWIDVGRGNTDGLQYRKLCFTSKVTREIEVSL